MIIQRHMLLRAAASLLCVVILGPAQADTTSYAGTMETYPVKRVMPLGSGDSVISGAADGVATIVVTTGGTPVLLSVICSGLGLLGEDTLKHLDFYCSFTADDDNSFDVHGREDASGFKAAIIGGSGRWKGATGTASFERVAVTESSAQTNFKLEMATP